MLCLKNRIEDHIHLFINRDNFPLKLYPLNETCWLIPKLLLFIRDKIYFHFDCFFIIR